MNRNIRIVFINYSPLELGDAPNFRKIIPTLHIQSKRIDLSIFEETSTRKNIYIPFKDAVYYWGIALGKTYINNFSLNPIVNESDTEKKTVGDLIIQLIELCENPNGNNVVVVGNPKTLVSVFCCIHKHWNTKLSSIEWDTLRRNLLVSEHEQVIHLNLGM